MIDLHSHILPGIDDGARSLEDSLNMARQSIDSGVTHMMCTPHIHQGVFDNDIASISLAFERLLSAIHLENIPLKLAFACEVRVCPDVLVWVQQKALPFIGKWQQRDALLLELPHSHVPPGVENVIRWLLKHNIQPVIPHPERNREIQGDFSKAKMLRRLGCVFQVTAGAFSQSFGQVPYDTAVRLLEDDYIDYVASDTHSVHRRPNQMDECKRELHILLGQEKAQQLVYDTPKAMTADIQWR